MEFDLTDDIENNENVVEVKADEKKNELFFAMMNGQTATGKIATSKGEFKVKFPKQKDIISIGRVAAFMRSGIAAANFDVASEYEIQKCATLDVMITGGPAWFEEARKKDKNFTWRNVPDAHFINEVYAKALEFRHGIQDQLAGNQENVSEDIDRENAGDVSSDVGDGVFSGASGSAKRDQS